jgi:hypothetical protein
MTSKSIKWLLWAGIITTFLVVAVVVAAAFVLPNYVETRWVPRLTKEFGLPPGDIQVRRIGLWGADLGPIRLLGDDVQAISIATVQIDYSPWSLVRGRIRAIAIGGMGLNVTITPQGISIPGLPTLSGKTTPPKSGDAPFQLETLLPVKLGRFSIYQSHLIIHQNQRQHVVPFEIRLQTQALSQGLLKGQTELSIFGNPLLLHATIDQPANHANINIEAKGFSLARLSQLGSMPVPIQAAGTVDFNAQASFGLQPLGLAKLSINGHFQNTHIVAPNVALENLVTIQGESRPIVLSIKGDRPSNLRWSCAPFRISSPVNMAINRFEGDLNFLPGRWSLNSTMTTLIPRQNVLEGTAIAADLPMGWQMAAGGKPSEKSISFDLLGQSNKAASVAMDQRKLSIQGNEIKINGHLQNDTLNIQGKYAGKEVGLVLPEGKIRVPLLNVDGTLTISPVGSNAASSMTAHAILSEVRSNFGSAVGYAPKITLEASGKNQPHQPWRFNARFKLSKGRITDASKAMKVKNILIDLPLKWPQAAGVKAGKIKIGTVQWDRHLMGGLKGTLQQQAHGMTMALRHSSQLFPGMRVLINGIVDKTGAASIQAEIPRYHPADEIDLGRFAKASAGIMVTGQIQAAGALTMNKGGIKGSARFSFNQGRLRQPSRELLFEGIDMNIQIDDIVSIKSAPQQTLSVGQLALGTLKAENLNVDFQLENAKTLFIEKMQIDWSEGKVNTTAIRIIPGVDEYDVTLFCDRLNLAMVLGQLGAAQADGQGTVNGRIPIHWSKGRLSFDNGFLYSTPGRTGTIKLSGTEVLLSGLPPGTPQHTQLDIATEALKDYTYKWAKLNVQTEDNTLLLKLQFDGKPNRLLPFAYDQALGQFKRVAGQGQADFKGISIDLNLRSPLNDIINYKELF